MSNSQASTLKGVIPDGSKDSSLSLQRKFVHVEIDDHHYQSLFFNYHANITKESQPANEVRTTFKGYRFNLTYHCSRSFISLAILLF